MVLEKILVYLEYISLVNVHKVRRFWNELVHKGRSWRWQLQAMVSKH